MSKIYGEFERLQDRVSLLRAFEVQYDLASHQTKMLELLTTPELEAMDEREEFADDFVKIFTLTDGGLASELCKAESTDVAAHASTHSAGPFITLDHAEVPNKIKARNVSVVKGIYSYNQAEFRTSARSILFRRLRLRIWTSIVRDSILAVRETESNMVSQGPDQDPEIENIFPRHGFGTYV